MIILIIRNILLFFKRNAQPDTHPLCKELSRLGDLEKIADQIDTEVGKLQNPKKNVLLTDSWIILKRFYKLDIIPYSDVVWVYQKVTTQKVNAIPTNKTYEIVIHTKIPAKHEIQVKKKDCQALISEIYDKAPWICAGYSEVLEKHWKKNQADFIKGVQDKYNQMHHGGAAS